SSRFGRHERTDVMNFVRPGIKKTGLAPLTLPFPLPEGWERIVETRVPRFWKFGPCGFFGFWNLELGAFFCLALFAMAAVATNVHGENSSRGRSLSSWLTAQTNIQSWSADFVQTRTFKSLTQPLTATGHVWFAEPNRFRWELGHPPQTIAVRATTEMLVIYPRLKRVERYPLSGGQTGEWRDALALLETGFPRSEA